VQTCALPISDGPADATDLEPGDVIVSLDGQPVEKAQDLSRRVARMSPSTEVRLGVVRNGREREVRVRLGERPDEGPRRTPTPEEEDAGLGLQVGPVPLDLQRRLRIDGGVLVIERSEEHTSELQSRENLVCRLLLEKKNQA